MVQSVNFLHRFSFKIEKCTVLPGLLRNIRSLPEKIHWMLPTEDFSMKNQIMSKFLGKNKETVRIHDSRKMNRVQLCKAVKQYELLTNLKDIQRDRHRYK